MTSEAARDTIGGVAFAKLYPNPAEPFRGAFVADQVRVTSGPVRWAVVAPVPWVPKRLAALFRKPYVKGDDVVDGVSVYRPRHLVLPKRILYSTVADSMVLSAKRVFGRACREVDARFVHGHDLYPSGAAARRLAESAGLPYVVTVHGLDLYSNLENPRWRREVRATARGAAAVVAVGERLARDAVRLAGADPAKTLVIPNTYDTRAFPFIEREPHGGPVRLLSVGRLSIEKGHDVLLRAFAALLADGADLTLELVGDGPERPGLEGLARELGIAGHVRFLGVLVGTQQREALARADLSVLPSRSEGFGVALIEAMATGLPVVATRSGGPDGIVGPDLGELVEPDDVGALAAGIGRAVERLPHFDRRAIAEHTAARYAPEAVAAQLVRLYREILSGAPISGALAPHPEVVA